MAKRKATTSKKSSRQVTPVVRRYKMGRDRFFKRVDELDDLRRKLNCRIACLLTDLGWKQTSDNPGCIWLWRKEIGGNTILVDQEHALSFEESLMQLE